MRRFQNFRFVGQRQYSGECSYRVFKTFFFFSFLFRLCSQCDQWYAVEQGDSLESQD